MKAIVAFLLLFTSISSFAQKLDTLMKGENLYNNAWQLSGIAIYNDRFYMPAEKCGKIIVSKTDGTIDTIIDLHLERLLSDSKVEMEAIAVYKHWLLITDESKLHPQVYSYDLKNGSLAILNTGNKLSNDFGFLGIEGIAVNEKDSICYVLKERNDKFQSEIRQFKIWDDGKTIQMDFRFNTSVQHQEKNIAIQNIRYADLVYDADKRRLLLLKSYFIKTDTFHPDNYYGIDTILLSKDGLLNRELIPNSKDELCLYNFTESVKKLAQLKLNNSKKYSTNLEGICVYRDDIFLVTDNAQSPDCNALSEERTLLLKLIKSQKK